MNKLPDILHKICTDKQQELAALTVNYKAEVESRAKSAQRPRGFASKLASEPNIAVIAELKKASPSKGIIREDFNPVQIAEEYKKNGAACISVLTDEKYFSGRLDYLAQVRRKVSLPVLRKDFMIDTFQITEAKAYGADCVLLIAAALGRQKLRDFTAFAHNQELDALVEVHTESELEWALDSGSHLIGINNRNLHTFEVDISTTEKLAKKVSEPYILISESGIKKRDDIERLSKSGISAVLVGESLMRKRKIGKTLQPLTSIKKKNV